jgi:colicin import membrane protein/protein TonB
MTAPGASALGRRDRLWPAAAVSALLHVALVGWAVVRRPPAPIDLEQKPIVAKLVRLGEKRPEEWLPRKEAPPPAAAAAPPAPAPVVAAPVPAPAARPSRPAPPAAKAPPAPKPPPPSTGRPGGTSLASVLSKVQREVEQTRWGAPDGDPSGDSDSASEGDRYLALVVRELKARYHVPSTISERERMHLKGTIVLYIEADGRIARWSFEARSGNGAFDDALDRTLRQTRLPPPPAPMRDLYRTTGLQVIFQIG